MAAAPEEGLHAWVEYLRDMGVYDLYRREPTQAALSPEVLERLRSLGAKAPQLDVKAAERTPTPLSTTQPQAGRPGAAPAPPPTRRDRSPEASRQGVPFGLPPKAPFARPDPPPATAYPVQEERLPQLPPELAAPMPKPNPLEAMFAPPPVGIPGTERGTALAQLQTEIGDCTRCPLAYAGRHTIVFGEGDPEAALMFVGEGPGADEDASGRPFVGKAGQLLNNMITAMGLAREQVFIANIVKCRPPGNRAPEFVEATTCSQFLLKQIDIVQPRIIVALGTTAATYLLGVRQPLSALRGQWWSVRQAKVAVTYHPAFLLRDPRQKAEAWKDLQRVMTELGLRAPGKA